MWNWGPPQKLPSIFGRMRFVVRDRSADTGQGGDRAFQGLALARARRRRLISFSYQAQSWRKPRRVVAKVEWHPGELYPRVGFILTNLARSAERVVAFYNQRGTAEQWIKQGKGAIKMDTPVVPLLRRQRRAASAPCARLQPGQFHADASDAQSGESWSLTSLREKLIKIGAKVVSHGRYVTFQMGRGRGAAADVCGNRVAHRPATRAARSGMTANFAVCRHARVRAWSCNRGSFAADDISLTERIGRPADNRELGWLGRRSRRTCITGRPEHADCATDPAQSP